ncbi:ABC transporter, permease protein [Actinomyces urogenitalis DSM 15434]|uniref:ABC transporter, permease protein n=4 Tax=Actinomyces urogenitalis TaxID=103621 RepID=C0W3I4_9ACTO|nr:ABC transporter, permease protein [Actinomyces urogenitalis DSM 15434]ETJ03383.1 MAG: Sugar ABC superfamily ATP binding cassette transporter, membrane protein [Actinomyces urogenitalis DORA_12]KGF03759.1 glycerol-3-phosphate ABC transporter permease [Actinomyces urogenitalis S6-C4]PKY99489.1 sugar ABC transporter permease [Actinomyces urogenitalis]
MIPGLQVRGGDEPPRRRRRTDLKQVLLAAALIGPNLVLLLVFTYRPLIDNIRISLYRWNISSPRMTFVGLDNYVQYFRDPESWAIMGHTLVFTAAAVVGSMVLGLCLALLLDRRLRGRNIVRSLVFMPYVISGAAIGVAFQFVFDPGYGLIQDLLARMGIASPNFYQEPGWALFMVTATYIWKNLGYTFVIYLAALQGRRTDLDEAAEIDRTSQWRKLWRVTLPQLRGTTVFLSITVLLNSFQVFDVIQVMTKGGPFETSTTTMVYQVYQETFVNNRAGYGAAVATVMFLVVLVLTVVQARTSKEA